MYFFNVHVIRNVLKRPWRKIYIPISAFSFILFSPAFVLIFCFLPQKTYFGFWEHKWDGGGQDLEKSFLILHALTDIFLDDLELKLINVQFYISHLYTLYCALLPVQYYQYICIVGKLWKVSLLFTYIPPYRISYSNFINCNSHSHWLRYFF